MGEIPPGDGLPAPARHVAPQRPHGHQRDPLKVDLRRNVEPGHLQDAPVQRRETGSRRPQFPGRRQLHRRTQSDGQDGRPTRSPQTLAKT